MEEITKENIEAFVHEALGNTQNQDLLKECMGYAARFEREDLMALILEKTIHQHRLIEKLQDYGMKSQAFIPFLSDDPIFDEEPTEDGNL